MDASQHEVRAARVEDAEALVRLHFDAVHEGAANAYPAEVLDAWSPPPDERRFAWMRGQIAAGQNRVLVAEAPDGSVSGFCIFGIPEGLIRAIYVVPAAAGRGIGRRLLQSAEREIAAGGASRARLNASKNALSFYRSAGYLAVCAATQELADGTRMDCIEMVKDVSRPESPRP